MTSRIEPELVALIEDIVAKRLKQELEERAKLVTEDKFAQAMERIDRRLEAARKERERLDRRLEEASKEREQGFSTILHTLERIQAQIGKPFEHFARNVVSRVLAGEGTPDVQLPAVKMQDPDHVVFPASTEIEIDGYSEDPPVIMEVTSILHEQDKVKNFLKKKRLVEEKTGKQFRGFFVAAGTDLPRETIGDLTVMLREHGSELLNM